VNQKEAFLQALRDNPADETTWLVFADWLEERGDPSAERYRQRHFSTGLSMEFILLLQGTFWMGGGGGRPGDRQVTIDQDFYLGVYPVTQEQFRGRHTADPSGGWCRG
jgi:uncharacterized protein (TIGR02996 family)